MVYRRIWITQNLGNPMHMCQQCVPSHFSSPAKMAWERGYFMECRQLLFRAHVAAHTQLHFLAEQSSAVVDRLLVRNRLKYTAKHVKKGQIKILWIEREKYRDCWKSKGDKIWYALDAQATWQRERISEIMVCVLCDCKINHRQSPISLCTHSCSY